MKNLPEIVPLPENLRSSPDLYLLNGGSAIIGPDSSYLVEPVFEKECILYHELEDLDWPIRERLTLDVSGHYSRNDVFDFNVNKKRL